MISFVSKLCSAFLCSLPMFHPDDSIYSWFFIPMTIDFKCRPLFNANSYPQSDSIAYRRVNDISIHLCWCCFIGVDWFRLFLPSQNTWIAFSHHGRWPSLTENQLSRFPGSVSKVSFIFMHDLYIPQNSASLVAWKWLKIFWWGTPLLNKHQLVLRLSWAVTI